MNKKTILAVTLSTILITPLLTPTADSSQQSKQNAYLDLIEQQISILEQLGSKQQVKNLENAKNNLLLLTDEQLIALPDAEYLEGLKDSNQMLLNQVQSIKTSSVSRDISIQATTTLTPPNYPNFPLCATAPGERHNDLVVFASEQALFVAEAVREVAARGCEQVAVVAGFGGNTSAACIITDAVYIAAKEANNIITYCDAEVDEAQLEATFLRTEDLFNLGHEVSNELLSHDTDIKSDISNHDLSVKAVLNIHDTDIKTALSTHDADIKSLLNQVLANQGEMLNNQATIIELLKTPQGKRPGWNQ